MGKEVYYILTQPSLLWGPRHTAPQPTISIVGTKTQCTPNPPSLLWGPRHTASPTHCPCCGQRGTLHPQPTVPIVGTKTNCTPPPPAITPVTSQCFACGKFSKTCCNDGGVGLTRLWHQEACGIHSTNSLPIWAAIGFRMTFLSEGTTVSFGQT